MSFLFGTGERALLDALTQEARDALAPLGLWPADGAFLAHRRASVRSLRRGDGRKPTHAQVAAATLEWARSEGNLGLYLTVALVVAVEASHGTEGLDRAVAAWPPLAHGRSAVPRISIPGSAGASSGA